MGDVELRPLREDEYDAWLAAHIAEYADGMQRYAGMTEEDARRKAERDMPYVLPDGIGTEGVRIWAIEAGGRTVGTIFFGIRDGAAWLYQITVDEEERGKGYGRAAMLALEAEVRRLGHASLALNVWGGNEPARSLYRSLGFAETSVHMAKPLDPRGAAGAD